MMHTSPKKVTMYHFLKRASLSDSERESHVSYLFSYYLKITILS